VFNDKDSIPAFDKATLYRFEEGTKIGEFAKKLFPDGVDLAGLEFGENIERTEEQLKSDKPVFEAGLVFQDCYARVDILVPVKDAWDIIEVKSSTKAKEEHVRDVSFQRYCAVSKGLKIRKCYVMHLDNSYVRKARIDAKKLFTKTDITSELDSVAEVERKVKEMFKVIGSDCPNIDIGPHCSNPYGCPVSECWDFLPEYNVTHLIRGGRKPFKLIEMGIFSIKDIPEDFKLTGHQYIQKKVEKEGKAHIDKEAIAEFLENLEYPIHYLDFETFNTGIPLFSGLKPYQQVVFQYSLHVQSKDSLKHYSFLSSDGSDPRKKFLESLKKHIGPKGSVLVYNKTFEIRILKGLMEEFPKEKKFISEVISRIVDLYDIFRNFNYYDKRQKGSGSLKNVLPVVAGKDYSSLEISDGTSASLAFLKITFSEVSSSEKLEVRDNLEKYCYLDTYGMVLVVEKLFGIVGG